MDDVAVTRAQAWLEQIEAGGSKGLRAFLLKVQSEFNWVPPQCLGLAADHFGMRLGEASEAAALTPGISLEPQGETVIQVCRGLACSDAHSADVMAEAASVLGIQPGQTSPDGKFTLKPHFCFGRCAIGPNVKVNQDFHANQTPASLGGILKKQKDC